MTRDEIIEMASLSGFDSNEASIFAGDLATFAELVAAKEREACVKVYEPHIAPAIAKILTDSIRARGTEA